MNAREIAAEKAECQRAVRALAQRETRPMADWLRHHLFGHVLPFWEAHAIDPQGGLFSCLSDEGEVLSTDKWLWSQWRAVWVFSRIYRSLDPAPRWLELARHIANFCLRSGWLDEPRGWALLLAQDGRVRRGHESTYTDAFAVQGLLELYRATGESAWLASLRQTVDATLGRLALPYETVPHFPYPIPPGAKPHGIPMLWSLTLAEAGAVLGEPRCLDRARALADEIFRDFYRAEREVVVEFVRGDGREFPGAQGTAIVPGHVVEDMWFQVHVAALAGGPPDRVGTAFRLMRRHLELGWDGAHGGGLLLAIDANGNSEVGWNFAETKLWWPQTEALYGTLLGWRETRQPEFFGWYENVWNVCLEHYVDWTKGEWRQKLDRDFRPLCDTIALPVKDPFHLPRSLILQIELLQQEGWRR